MKRVKKTYMGVGKTTGRMRKECRMSWSGPKCGIKYCKNNLWAIL